MEPTLILLAGFGLFFAGVVKGMTGLGYSSCALPFLVPAIGLRIAIVLIVIPAMVSNFQVLVTTGHFRETLARFARLYIAMLPGIAIGLVVLSLTDPRLLTRFLGLIIVGYATLALVRPVWTLSAPAERMLQIPVGFSNGLIAGLTGSQVMPLFPYMLSLPLDANRLVQAINLAVTLASAVMAIGLVAVGLLTKPLAFYSIAAVAPAMVGVGLGSRARRLVPLTHFRQLVLTVLLLMGVVLLT